MAWSSRSRQFARHEANHYQFLYILRRIPSSKTTSLPKHYVYVSYICTHLDNLFNFYGPKMARKIFFLYQYRQRAVGTLKKSSNVCSFGVLACTTYCTLWQRDVNASNNAMTIAHSIWRGEGYSDCFQKNVKLSPNSTDKHARS